MLTYLDCMPCFLKQALYTARLSTSSLQVQEEIMARTAGLLSELDFSRTPPENATPVYELIAEISGCKDPFAELKKESNQLALDLQENIRDIIKQSDVPLFTAIKYSIAGNIIDYGAHHDFDILDTINKCSTRELVLNDYEKLCEDLNTAEKILYLGDNSGEVAFDSLVIEQLDQQILFAVRGKPIINDALREDAQFCGLDRQCEIISNGTNCPGTPLSRCSAEFREAFNQADLIISKGQGNFETLSEVRAPIYFLLSVKCPVVARHIFENTGRSVQNGDMILLKGIG